MKGILKRCIDFLILKFGRGGLTKDQVAEMQLTKIQRKKMAVYLKQVALELEDL